MPLADGKGPICNIIEYGNRIIEFLDGLYYPGYAACFVDKNPDAYYRQLAEFQNLYKSSDENTFVFNRSYRGRNRIKSTGLRAGVRKRDNR
jgi:hypothetical protein